MSHYLSIRNYARLKIEKVVSPFKVRKIKLNLTVDK